MWMHLLLQSFRMTWRDWRAGEFRFLLVALMIAVGALSSVGFFVDRVSNGLQRNASQLLGADLVLSSDKPIDADLRKQVQGFQQAETTSFVSMVRNDKESMAETQSKLVSVKAVSIGYPLRGNLTLHIGEVRNRIPEPGTVWVDEAVLTALNIGIGQKLKLGSELFTITHVIKNEPDRSSAYINFAPRVMLALSDLEKTDLIKSGSRATYRLLLSGIPAQISALQSMIENKIAQHKLVGITVESLATGRPEMYSTLEKAKQFLALVSLISAFLAALAIALASRRFMLRHMDACAMLRCLGLTQTQVTIIYFVEFIILGLLASLLGAVLGYVGHLVLLIWLKSFISTVLPNSSVLPALQSIAIGMLLLIGFAIAPILQLRNVPHNLMLRRELGPPKAHTIFAYLLGIVVFGLLLCWQTGNIKLASYTFAGFLVVFIFFALCAWLFLRLMRYMHSWFHFPAWRFAIRGLRRRSMSSVVQVVALSLGLMALLLLTVIRTDLLTAWHKSTPADAPNHFIVNIFSDQKEAISELLQQHHIPDPTFYPMIRGRLISVNDVPVNAKDYEAENAKRLIEREFNLSTMGHMQSHNRLIAGQWFSGNQSEASVEEGIAKTFRLKLGDKLSFEVAGQPVEVIISSIRKLEWDSMQVNFFMIIDPASAVGLPQTWITAFYLPKHQQVLINKLTRQFPNLTIVDTGIVLQQIHNMLQQVSDATEFLFLFTLASGLLVLYAAMQSSQQERLHEAAILRALGASKNQLSKSQWIEYSLLGSLAGLLAASGAAIIGWVLSRWVFEFSFQPNPLLWVFGLSAGTFCALIGSSLGLRHILHQSPILSLREE